MNCDFCGKEEALPFVCNYCGGAFCADHRLPEAHQCKGDLTQKRAVVAPPQTTFSWQTQAPPTQAPRPAGVYTRIEKRDKVIAWLALGFAFALSLGGGGALLIESGVTPTSVAYLVALALLTVGPGFVFHELSHKFVAQRYGFWAEFRMWPMGLALALITSLIGFIFAAPGATYISGMNISREENGRISVAGPLVNIMIGALFLPFLLYSPTGGFLFYVGLIGSYINFFLSLFNLLPFGPLDGAKVFRWNAPLWVAAFVASGAAWFWVLSTYSAYL